MALLSSKNILFGLSVVALAGLAVYAQQDSECIDSYCDYNENVKGSELCDGWFAWGMQYCSQFCKGKMASFLTMMTESPCVDLPEGDEKTNCYLAATQGCDYAKGLADGNAAADTDFSGGDMAAAFIGGLFAGSIAMAAGGVVWQTFRSRRNNNSNESAHLMQPL